MKIAIGITTTPNRKGLFAQTFLKLVENTPLDVSYKIYSDDNYEGIAKAKNKTLALCDGADFVFLLDDDIYPLDHKWVYKYIVSGLSHAMYIFDRVVEKKTLEYTSYNLPRGCMLFFTRHCINTAGGFDERFQGWGYEHAELSRRIYNMDMTPAPYLDIRDSKGLFYSHDEHFSCKSSVPNDKRAEGIIINQPLFAETINSNKFIPYK